jgi:hypothetical protein
VVHGMQTTATRERSRWKTHFRNGEHEGAPATAKVTGAFSIAFVMGLDRVELSTSRLSGVRSNHLSYRPGKSREN